MKNVAIFLVAVLCSGSIQAHSSSESSESSSSSSSGVLNWRVGDFTLVAFAQHERVILSNNKVYEGVSSEDKAMITSWKLDDTIRVLGTQRHRRYLLVNLNTGETVTAKAKAED